MRGDGERVAGGAGGRVDDEVVERQSVRDKRPDFAAEVGAVNGGNVVKIRRARAVAAVERRVAEAHFDETIQPLRRRAGRPVVGTGVEFGFKRQHAAQVVRGEAVAALRGVAGGMWVLAEALEHLATVFGQKWETFSVSHRGQG